MAPVGKIIFLDRDGTINVDHGYVCKTKNMELIPGAADALAKLKHAGFVLVVVSNQSAIGRGISNSKEVEEVNNYFKELLIKENPEALIDDILYCPHAPEEKCSCRKPQISLVKNLEGKYEYSSSDCWLIGDKRSDIEFAENLGIPFKNRILVLTGSGSKELQELKNNNTKHTVLPQHCESIKEAVELLLSRT